MSKEALQQLELLKGRINMLNEKWNIEQMKKAEIQKA